MSVQVRGTAIVSDSDPRSSGIKLGLALCVQHYFGLTTIVDAYRQLLHMSFQDRHEIRQGLLDEGYNVETVNEWETYRENYQPVSLPAGSNFPVAIVSHQVPKQVQLFTEQLQDPPFVKPKLDKDGPNYEADERAAEFVVEKPAVKAA